MRGFFITMILDNNMTFGNNGNLGTYTYKLELFNFISQQTYEFTGDVDITNTRSFTIVESFSEIPKGQYKGSLFLDENLDCTFLGLKEFEAQENYVNDEEKTKYIVE